MGLTSPYRVIEPLSDRLCRHFFTLSSSRIDFFATLVSLFRRLPSFLVPRRGNNNRGNIGINLSHTHTHARARVVSSRRNFRSHLSTVRANNRRLFETGDKRRHAVVEEEGEKIGWRDGGGPSTQRALRLERWRGVDGRRVANLDVN